MHLRRKRGLRRPYKPRTRRGATPRQVAAARHNIYKAQLYRLGVRGQRRQRR